MKYRRLESEVSHLLLEIMILLVRCSDLEGASIKTCANFTKKIHGILRTRHGDSPIFVISVLYMHFLQLEYQQGLYLWPHPVAELFEFSPISRTMNEKPQSDTQMILLASTHVQLRLQQMTQIQQTIPQMHEKIKPYGTMVISYCGKQFGGETMKSCFHSNKNMLLVHVNVFKQHMVHPRKPCAYKTVADAPLAAREI